jgi:dipeptidyl aminopeptidase/acylaminoacyl peptidase
VLADAEASAVYVSSGHLLFPRQGTLLAQRFDAERMSLIGEPWQVSDSVRVDLIQGLTVLSASDVGSIVYRPEDFEVIERRLVWLDRAGKELQRLDDRDPVNTNHMALSPAGDRLAVRRGRTSGIWLVDTERGALTQLSERFFTYPLWSPDGNRLIFTSQGDGTLDLYQRTLTAQADELLFTAPGTPAAHDWSPDGRLLLYRDVDPRTGFDLLAHPIEHDSAGLKPAREQEPIPIAQTLSTEMNGQFSPDGAWIAYESDESGRFEIYVQPFGRQGSRERISVDGGSQARWRRDGRELYYIAPDGRLMAVPILRSSTDLRIDIGAPVSLFTVRVAAGTNNPYQYFVSPDGQRFLVNTVTDTSPGVVSAIVNWAPAR